MNRANRRKHMKKYKHQTKADKMLKKICANFFQLFYSIVKNI